MATSELAAKLAAMRARMDGADNPTSNFDAQKKQMDSHDASSRVDIDDTHSIAFGGGKPSAILASLKNKKTNQIYECEPLPLENESETVSSNLSASSKEMNEFYHENEKDGSNLSFNGNGSSDSLSCMKVTEEREQASSKSSELLPIIEQDCSTPFEEVFMPANPSPRMKQLHKAKCMNRKGNRPKMVSNSIDSNDESIIIMNNSLESLSNSYDLEVRPLLVSNSQEYQDTNSVRHAQYESLQNNSDSMFYEDPNISDEDRLLSSSKSITSESHKQSNWQNSNHTKIIRQLQSENNQLKDELNSMTLLIKEKDELIDYLVQRLEEFENIEYISATFESESHSVQTKMNISEQPMELKSALKNSSPTKNSRRFIC